MRLRLLSLIASHDGGAACRGGRRGPQPSESATPRSVASTAPPALGVGGVVGIDSPTGVRYGTSREARASQTGQDKLAAATHSNKMSRSPTHVVVNSRTR